MEFIKNLLKNSGCSYCQENDYNDIEDLNKNWNLYLKEGEMYSCLILFNEKTEKDISFYVNINAKIKLYQKEKLMLELEYISKSEDNKYGILVPLENYQEYYQDLEKKNKKYDKKLESYLVDKYDIIFENN
jgi:hypothetical protein